MYQKTNQFKKMKVSLNYLTIWYIVVFWGAVWAMIELIPDPVFLVPFALILVILFELKKMVKK